MAKTKATKKMRPERRPSQKPDTKSLMRVLLEQADPRAKAEERFRYQQLRDGMPKPSLQGDMVTVIKVPPESRAGGPVTLPIASGAALAAAAAIPKGRRRGGGRAERKAAATRTEKRAEAAIKAAEKNLTPNGSPVAFTGLADLDEQAADKFRISLGKDYQHPNARSAAVEDACGRHGSELLFQVP